MFCYLILSLNESILSVKKMETQKEILILAVLLISVLAFGVITGQLAVPEGNLDELNVDARNEPLEKADWLSGEAAENDPVFVEYVYTVQDILTSKDSSVLKDVYGGRYVNPANNTLFLSVTQTDPETLSTIDEELNIPDTITVIYRKCSYTKTQLDQWDEEIQKIIDPLRDKGVIVTGCGVKGKGYIWIELVEVSYNAVSTLLEYLPESVPKDALMIRKGEIAQTT